MDNLVCFAKTQPHAAYSAFMDGLTSIWSYTTRTIPEIGHLLQPLEDIIAKSPLHSYDMWASQVAARSDVHKLKRLQS